jgi:hypothetical protein
MKPDTMDDLQNSDLIQLSRKLLDVMIGSTNMMSLKKMTPEKLRECKTVLSYLNSCNSIMKTRISVFRLTGMEEKIKFMKDRAKEM